MPREGYGFSKNISFSHRQSSFNEVEFEINEDKNLTIKMVY